MSVVMCMLSKVNLKKENISADLVIWIINKQCLEIPLRRLYFTSDNRLLFMSLISNVRYCVCETNFMFSYLELMSLLMVEVSL